MSATLNSTTVYKRDFRLGDWLVLPSLNRLVLGSEIVQIEPKAMEVLVDLAEHAGEVRSKRRLMQAVWCGAFVTDDVLVQAIRSLRRALKDDAKNPKYIETIPRRGYRLAEKVSSDLGGEIEASQGIGHYKILERLGSGGMGVVYRAKDERLKRSVALKFLPPEVADDRERLARFQREAEALAALNHPNIVTIHAVEQDRDRRFLVMEFVEGVTLADRLPRDGHRLGEFFDIAVPLADALAVAHQHGIVHRDLKPANIMITKDGSVKVLDFGLAKLRALPELNRTAESEALTQTGRVVGTATYMSPEQLQGHEIDHRSDIFSLGIVLYLLATGKRPFEGETPADLLSSILRDTPQPADELNPRLPHHLSRILRHCLEKDRERRLQSAKDLRNELQDLRRELRTQETSAVVPPPQPRTLRRWLLVMVLAVALGCILWWSSGRPRPTSSRTQDVEVQRLLGQGRHYEARGDTREDLENAERNYRRALELQPGNPRAAAELAALLARIQAQFPEPERVQEIEELADLALEADPKLALAWVARGRIQLLGGDAKGAARAGRTAVEAAPDDFRGYVLEGRALIDQGETEAGLARLREGIGVGSGFIWARLRLALALRDLGEDSQAAAEFEKVLEYVPDSPGGLNNLALIYLLTGRNADAIPLFHRFLERSPDDYRAWSNLGYAFYNLDRMDEAIEAFKRAHQLGPEDPDPARNLGDAYEKIGQDGEAREWFQRALVAYDRTLDSGAPRAWYLALRSVCKAKLGIFEGAVRDVEEALQLSPNNTYIVFSAAQVFALAGDSEKLYEYTRQALAAGSSREDFFADLCFRDYQADPEFRALLDHTIDEM